MTLPPHACAAPMPQRGACCSRVLAGRRTAAAGGVRRVARAGSSSSGSASSSSSSGGGSSGSSGGSTSSGSSSSSDGGGSGSSSQQPSSEPPPPAPARPARPAGSWGSQAARPVRPSMDVQTAQQHVEQRQGAQPQRLLPWRSRRGAAVAKPGAAAPPPPQPQPPQQQPPQQLQQQQQQQQQQQLPERRRQQQQQPQHEVPQLRRRQQQQQQQQLPQLEQRQPQQQPHLTLQQLPARSQQQQQQQQQPFVASPVVIVAADTPTRALAGSLVQSFAVHDHQLLFAVGPHALGQALKGLATARAMLAGSARSPDGHIVVQPTLRARISRRAAFALDVARVQRLPLTPGVPAASPELASGPNATRAKLVHITSSSNEAAAAHNLVANMPCRGQTIMRVTGPAATETAVHAVALARPLMRAAWGQDLAMVVLWSANRGYHGAKTGLLLAVMRCEPGSFPPAVLLGDPVAKRAAKRAGGAATRTLGKEQPQPLHGQAGGSGAGSSTGLRGNA